MYMLGFTIYGVSAVELIREPCDETDRMVFNQAMFEGIDFINSLPLAEMEDVFNV